MATKLHQITPTQSVRIGAVANEPDQQQVKQQLTEHTALRTTYVKAQNEWKYINIAVIINWKVKRVPNLTALLVKINDVLVKPSNTTDEYFEFDLPTMREQWFNLIGDTPRECDLLALEDACMFNHLKAIQSYTTAPKDVLSGTMFTDDLTIIFVPVWKPRIPANQLADKLEIHETYVISDVHKQTYSTH